MPLGSKVKTPMITPLPATTNKAAEEAAARRDLEERMRRATMNRAKSKLTAPALVKPVQTNRPQLLESLG